MITVLITIAIPTFINWQSLSTGIQMDKKELLYIVNFPRVTLEKYRYLPESLEW